MAAVDLYHGLAAWDFEEAARAGDSLVVQLQNGARWIPTEIVRRGTAIARLRLGDPSAAARLYTSLTTLGGWGFPDEIVQAYIDSKLATSPAGASAAPAPPRH
jgi:hypothetical protein